MKNIAVIGAGFWGKNLVRVFSQLRSLSTVCDKNSELLKTYEKQYKGIKITTNHEEILQDKNIKGVVIAVPAALHYRLVKEALLSYKHVFVEKPLSLSVSEGRELVDLAKKNKRILMVGHILQYHNAVIKLKELVDKGELGKIQYIYSNRLNIGKIRTEENILWSFAPHDISAILMLLGQVPESIYTTGGSYLQHNIPDVTLTTMNFPNGVKANIFVSWLHPFKEQKLVVIGDKKMAVFDDVSKEKLFLYPHKVEWIDRIPVACKANAEIVSFKMQEPLMNECRHFLESIEKESAPKTDGNEGLRVLQILDISQKSLNSGKVINMDNLKKSKKERYFIHESSYVENNVDIGVGTQVWHFSHILEGSRIGKKCKIGQNVVIGPEATIGDNCKIQNNVSVYKGVILEDDVFCGPSMVFTNVLNPRSAIPRMGELKRTLVKKGATIGANATILCGITIGRYAFIGAGATVTHNIADYALVYGNPATVKGWMCECGIKLDFKNSDKIKCMKCGKYYIFDDGKVVRKDTRS